MIFVVSGFVQINIPYVKYFYERKANKFIKTYTSLCQFQDIGKFKWPPVNLTIIEPYMWLNVVAGSDLFSQERQVFLVKEFINKKGKKAKERNLANIMKFFEPSRTFFDKIAKCITFISKEKQEVLVLYRSDANYTRIIGKDEDIVYTGEHSLLFVFYLQDRTQIYRVNNAEIYGDDQGGQPDDKITYFYLHKTKLERL
jgi:hypothetical protein